MKNEMLLKKAFKYIPRVHETEVEATETVLFEKETNGEIKKIVVEDYKNQKLQKGSEIILDFGNHEVGYLSLKLDYEGSHPDAPVWMKIHFAEQPVELFENAAEYKGWISSSWIEEEQIHVDIVPSILKLPRRYAFRYVKIQILDMSNKFFLVINDAVCTAVSSADDTQLKEYTPAKELHSKLDAIACRTLHNCMQSVFEDGPKRDRRLWLGDLRMQAMANYETYQNNEMVKACLYLFAALPMDNGQMGACLFLDPTPEVDDTVMFDYSLFFIATLRDYYEKTRDIETLKELWPTALSQIYIAEERIGEKGIIEDSNALGWCFVDWNLSLNKQASAQGIFMYCLLAAIDLAKALGEDGEKNKLVEMYKNAKKDALRELWDESKECFVSGNEKQISIASQVWMILGGAIEGEAASDLIERIENQNEKVDMVTPYMYHNYIDALIKINKKDKALEKLEEYWGGMEALGADTFWELYNPKNPDESPYGGTVVNSYCHAWSCAPAYFLRKYFSKTKK